jgi:hypothetical protein
MTANDLNKNRLECASWKLSNGAVRLGAVIWIVAMHCLLCTVALYG